MILLGWDILLGGVEGGNGNRIVFVYVKLFFGKVSELVFFLETIFKSVVVIRN